MDHAGHAGRMKPMGRDARDMSAMHGNGRPEAGHENTRHHDPMVADFRKRFWISLFTTVPVLVLSPMIQRFLGFGGRFRFTGDIYVLLILSSFIFFYGGYPFLKGFVDELKAVRPGMMSLVALADHDRLCL